jgi:hypothetical protein
MSKHNTSVWKRECSDFVDPLYISIVPKASVGKSFQPLDYTSVCPKGFTKLSNWCIENKIPVQGGMPRRKTIRHYAPIGKTSYL